ncbi:hypothetical protein GWA97_13405 [Flavobacterium sp. LaA7.5]|nr:hypothetical protein [Flavobacterium salilacus subsp. altitudinum]
MKTRITLLLLMFSIFSFGQNFPGENVELLLNKEVTPIKDEVGKEYLYKNFYVEFDTISKKLDKYKKKAHAFPKGLYFSDYDKLVGKNFKVTKIYPTNQQQYSVLEIKNDEIGVLYYHYDSKYDFSFELEIIGGLDLPEDFYCKKIDVKVDKFENKQSYFTPYTSGVLLMKTVKNGKANIFLSINELGKTLNVGKTGLTLLLENGKKISKPDAKIDVETNGYGEYVYNTLVLLTEDDIKLLLENNITDNRLYIYDGVIKKEDAEVIREYLKCLTK